MEKERLRREFRVKREKLTPEQVGNLSAVVIQGLIDAIDWTAVKSIHIYQPISSLAEIDTSPLLEFLSESANDIRIVIQGRSRLSKFSNEKFDLIIVPCLAFDSAGHRLGWGGGWYDRFLAAQPQAQKIGLAYQDSLVPDLPHEPHDMKMDKIVTEAGIYR